jgi:hypothetical protein
MLRFVEWGTYSSVNFEKKIAKKTLKINVIVFLKKRNVIIRKGRGKNGILLLSVFFFVSEGSTHCILFL